MSMEEFYFLQVPIEILGPYLLKAEYQNPKYENFMYQLII